MTVKLQLLYMEHGMRHENVTKLFVTSAARIGLAQLDNGTWYALNSRSADPCSLANKEERSAWARAQGIPAKDVESYVRRTKAERNAMYLRENLDEARKLLVSNGYSVTAHAQVAKREENAHA
jgi:hypothetical protein